MSERKIKINIKQYLFDLSINVRYNFTMKVKCCNMHMLYLILSIVIQQYYLIIYTSYISHNVRYYLQFTLIIIYNV